MTSFCPARFFELPEREERVTKSKLFYWIAGSFLAIAIVYPVGRFVMEVDRDVSRYPTMSREERFTEYEALRREAETPTITLESYFEMLYRFRHLELAMERARTISDANCHGYCGPSGRENDPVSLRFNEQNYVNEVLQKLPQDQRFVTARDSSNYVTKYNQLNALTASTSINWRPIAFCYFTLLIFTFGHFVIRIEAMGGRWWFAAATDWRFPFWLTLCPFGVFKYPTEVDVKSAVARAWRFAVGLLTASISLASVGCVGKRVKTEPDGQYDDGKTWVVNVDAVTWPSYLGANGAIFHPAPVEQFSATLSHKSGLYAGTWTSVPLSPTNLFPNFGREIDGSVGWNGKVLHGSSFSFDSTLIGVTPIARYRGDVLQFTASLGRSVKVRGHTVSPYFTYRHATPTVGENPGSGTFLMAGASTGFGHGRISGTLKAEFMTDSGAFGFNPGRFLDGGGSFGTNLRKELRLEVPWRFSVPISATNDGRKKEAQVGLRLAWQN